MSREHDQPRLVVGVGATADGLESFKRLVSVLPSDSGMAFVLVPDLDISRTGLLTQVLTPLARLAVAEVTEDTELRPNTIYILHPEASLALRGTTIEVGTAEAEGPPRRPLDYLFRSLARELGPRAAGIALAGAGPLGSGGLREIRAQGGLAIAEEPDPEEPASAIDRGIAEVFVPIEEIPQVLGRFANLPRRVTERADSKRGGDERAGALPGLEGDELAQLNSLLEAALDFDLRVYKAGTIKRRVLRRMALAGFDSFPAYLDRLQDDTGEQRTLVRDFLISVTDFFRDAESFRMLRETVIEPLVAEATTGRTLRLWVPACATGEEAYSLGMEVLDAIASQDKQISVQIFATDVDEHALSVARAGVYPASIAEHVSEQRLARYFQPLEGGRYRVRPDLRNVVSFAAHDLTKDPPFSRMDLVSCRNVLIYLTSETQEHVLKALHFSLRPEGYLFLSPSESTRPQRELFATVSKPWRIYRKVGHSRPITVRRSRNRVSQDRDVATSRLQAQAPIPARARRATGAELAQRAVLQACVPPTVVISADGAVLFMHGELGPYLRFPQGEHPRLDLAAILRPEIATRTRGALYKCRRTGATVQAMWSPDDARGARVRITARPATDLGEGTVILSFEDVEEGAPAPAQGVESPAHEALIDQLEKELQATREDLQNTVAELETSNEELRSSNEESSSMNEELQSANEELEATTEELRSLNEELTTVNAQLREKVEEVEQAHDDLDNFFSSTKVATVFLDERLSIKRFTAAAAELLGLDDSDAGRYVADIARELLQNGLEDDARRVLKTLSPQSRELHTQDGRWIARQVLPYRTATRRIEGAVVTFIDITALKTATERLSLRERQQAVVARIGLHALKEPDLQAFMEQAVRDVQQTLETDFCKVLELQPGHKLLLLRAGVGWPPGLVGSACVGTGPDSQAGYTLRASEPVIVDDLSTEKRFSGPSLLTDNGVTSGLSCVIRSGEHEYGVLGAHTRARRAFTSEDANFLQAVASVIGSAVSSHQTRLRLAIERSVAQALAEPVDAGDAFVRVIESTAAELHTTVGEIWWPDDEGRLVCRLRYVSPPGDRDRVEACFGRPTFSPGDGPLGRVYSDARALWCTDLGDDESFVRGAAARELGLVTGLAFPISSGKDVLGVVCVFSRERLAVNEVVLRSLEGIGRSIGDFVSRSEFEQRARRLAAITESSHDAIFSCDATGRVTEWLPGAERLFGYSAQEMVGQPIDRIVPDNRREELEALQARILQGEVVDTFETTRRCKDGRLVDVSVRSSAIRDRQGNVIGISSTDRDVTRQKETERRLLAADRQKDAFLAMLGHELRNPLAAIRSVAELIKFVRGTDPRMQRVQTVLERQTVHMAKLLDGLLDVSRIIRGKIKLDREVVDFAAICREVVADTLERIPRRDLDIHTELPDEPVWLEADRVRLAQIVDNLLSNAIKYTADGGAITLALTRARGMATLTVRDTGVGIDPELLPHIFDVFRQSQQSLDRSYGGLGVGLALVKSLAELHGGHVEARSEGAEQGAEFVVRMPVLPSMPSDERGRAEVRQRPLRILLVEDNEDAAEMLRQVLELAGHTVQVATRGKRGVEMAREQKPDLILCDLGLPDGMTGFDVAEELRSDREMDGVKLVALSGYGRPDDKARGAAAGFDAHITKPVDIDTLSRVIDELQPGENCRVGGSDSGSGGVNP